MSVARFKVLRAGPLVTFQDGGRPGYLRFGVPASGPMDRVSFHSANLAVGNARDATAIEVSIVGIELECIDGDVSMAIAGQGFVLTVNGEEFSSGRVVCISAGQKLSVRPGRTGSWCYLAFAGALETDSWLGKSATHSQSGFGGGIVGSGQVLNIKDAEVRESRKGEFPSFDFRRFDGYARVVLGPQDHRFIDGALTALLNSEFSVTTFYDRMGIRLEGPPLEMRDSLSIPSEPIAKGSIQVNGSGIPTILLADHQTTGGYPKIATVISSDVDRIAQLRPREKLRFKAVEPIDAVKIARVRAIELNHYFEMIS